MPQPPEQHWLMKTEPEAYAIHDLERDGRQGWDGVRSFQARNHMRAMRLGDRVLFYHSSVSPPGVAGLAKVVRLAYPDPSQFDPESPYFDRRSSEKRTLWEMVDIAFVERFASLVPLSDLRQEAALAGMLATKRGLRLSVQPVEAAHYDHIVELAHRRAREA